MLPVINIGPLALPAPAFILLIGVWIALEMAEKQAELFGASPRHIYNLTLTAILAGLVGARLAYAAQAPQAFIDSPLSLLSPRPEMLDSTGGIVLAVLAAAGYAWVRRVSIWPALDALTTLFAVLAVALGLSHFASGDAFGAPAQLAWSINLWGELRHPSQVYETLAALGTASLVWPGSRTAQYSQQRPGLRWWVFLALSAAARLVLESFRGDSVLLLNMFRQAQVIAWLVLAVSLWQIGVRIKRSPRRAETQPSPIVVNSEQI
jgi:prolipoprotein diacylglyceryltransferase